MDEPFSTNRSFHNPGQAIDFLAACISQFGTPGFGGPEEEIPVLDRNGKLIPYDQFKKFVSAVARELPGYNELISQSREVKAALDEHGKMAFPIGSIEPEVYTLIEFAHAPQLNAKLIDLQSSLFSKALTTVAEREGWVVIGAGALPTVAWDDFRTCNAITPLKDGSNWDRLMLRGERPDDCRMVFGTASVHHNLGFNDPERMARHITTMVRLMPTMIALLGNAPFWDSQIQASGDANLLTYRGKVQLARGVEYPYPDFLLDAEAKFHDIVLGYMKLPLGRTFIDDGIFRGNSKISGREVECGNLTMLDYFKGFECKGQTYYPCAEALHMMLHGPIVDVRPSMIRGPRVETRAHDCVSRRVAVAIDALYRGLNELPDALQDLMRGMSHAEIRLQREQVCWQGLQSRVEHSDRSIQTQQELALRVLRIAEQGLMIRDQGEAGYLAPLKLIAATGINPGERMRKAWRDASGNLLTFFHEMRYDRPGLDKDMILAWPTRQALPKASAALLMATAA